MLSHKKGKPSRLYILEDDEAALEKLCESTGLTSTMVMTLLVSAGLKAACENNYRLPLPLKFKIVQEVESGPVETKRARARL